MVLTNDAKELLSNIFSEFKCTGHRSFSISFDDDEPEEVLKLRNALDLLEEYLLIEYEACAFGFVQFKLTTDGLEYCNDDIDSVRPVHFVQGNNNIIIQGSGNLVSGCYNTIHSEIQSSDLPDEVKQLIESLLFKMQESSLSPEKKKSAISSFLQDITSGVLSDTASAGLIAILSQLFQNLPL